MPWKTWTVVGHHRTTRSTAGSRSSLSSSHLGAACSPGPLPRRPPRPLLITGRGQEERTRRARRLDRRMKALPELLRPAVLVPFNREVVPLERG